MRKRVSTDGEQRLANVRAMALYRFVVGAELVQHFCSILPNGAASA